MAKKPNPLIVEAFNAAIEAHNAVIGLDNREVPGTLVWHMIASAIEYCRHYSLDFDAIREEVREEVRDIF